MMLLWQARKARAEYERAMRILRQDLIRVNAEKADMAAERVGMIRTIEKLSRQDTEARKQFANSAGAMHAARRQLTELNADLKQENVMLRQENLTLRRKIAGLRAGTSE